MLDVAAAFSLAPEKALEFFRRKGIRPSFAWQDVWQAENSKAFTVAKMMDVDLLRDVRDAVERAIAEGQSFEEFRKQIEPTLQEAGWWGVKEVTDPLTGEIKMAELGSPRRLRTIYRVNLQTSYSAGRWQQMQLTRDQAGFLLYDAVDDSRTRDEHAAWDGVILPASDPWWTFHYPPNGFNCRCTVIQLTEAQAAEMGYTGQAAPAVEMQAYTNPRTGQVIQMPKGVDPGFAYNPGSGDQRALDQALQQRKEGYRRGG